jgi:CRISPR system Cascade subunit CasC
VRLELHILQNFAPSNLNRDDTGSPKDCEFGGYRRARISSQALKRAARRDGRFQQAIEGLGAIRTRRLAAEVASRLNGGGPAPQATLKLVAEVFTAGGLDVPMKKGSDDESGDNTKILVFASKTTIDNMADVFRESLDPLKGGRDSQVRADAVQRLAELLVESAHAPDIALFGRMLEVGDKTPFGKRNLRVDAAAQVAHAISTNRVSMEFDYFTAVDDLNPEGITGAGMIGTVEFNSACYYRYANVDINQLTDNLGGDADLARKTLRAFVDSSIHAIPTGKQNSMAAQNVPAFVFAVVREGGPWSLANAFLQPIRPSADSNLEEASAENLADYWSRLSGMYGAEDLRAKAVATYLDDRHLGNLGGHRVANVNALVDAVMEAVS